MSLVPSFTQCRFSFLFFKDEKLLRQSKLPLETVDTKIAGYRFRTTKLDRYNEDYLELIGKYQKFQQEAIEQLVEVAGTVALKLLSRPYAAPLQHHGPCPL